MRATEFIVEGVAEGLLEVREGTMREIIRKILPTWPEYVIKDWISSRIKNQEDLKNLTGWLVDLNKMVEPNSWKLHQKMFLTFDMLNPRTRYSMKTKRQFGARNPFLIPRDEERNANAEQLVKTKGMENLPPVIMIQHSNGLELCEGWHRTMAAFRLNPEGFYVNAWIGQAGQQGVAEGNFDSFKFGKPITFTAYHSSDSEIKKILPTDEFYFSDDRYTWEGNYLYKIKITLKNPYVVLDQKAGYEGHATDSLPKIKAAGYDGVIYTPHSVDYGFRQGVCFYPQQQISNIKLVNSDSGK